MPFGAKNELLVIVFGSLGLLKRIFNVCSAALNMAGSLDRNIQKRSCPVSSSLLCPLILVIFNLTVYFIMLANHRRKGRWRRERV